MAQGMEVADQEGEEPDIEDLLDQAAVTSSPWAQAQNSAARVMSMATRVVATDKATSPPSRPKPLSM
jgi:hypothetical protein